MNNEGEDNLIQNDLNNEIFFKDPITEYNYFEEELNKIEGGKYVCDWQTCYRNTFVPYMNEEQKRRALLSLRNNIFVH